MSRWISTNYWLEEPASINDWGREFQLLITLIVKKDVGKQLVWGLNNFLLCPLVANIVENEKMSSTFNDVIIIGYLI